MSFTRLTSVGFVLAMGVTSASFGHENAAVYVMDDLKGQYAQALNAIVEVREVDAAQVAESRGVILLTGRQINSLSDEQGSMLATAYDQGWAFILTDVDGKHINQLHGAVRSGQRYVDPPEKQNAMEALAFSRQPASSAESTYRQLRVHVLGSDRDDSYLKAQRAVDTFKWADSRLHPSLSAEPLKLDSEPEQSLTALVTAWPDDNLFYYTENGLQSQYQCNVSVWQAYQVSTQYDYYYVEQNCNFTPQNTYQIRGKTLDVTPLPMRSDDDWDDVAWSVTSDYCVPSSDSGKAYTACDYHNYVTNYAISLAPYDAAGTTADTDAGVIQLVTEGPVTTQGSTTVTQGVSYNIGGQVVAGTTNSNVSVSAGVTISDQTTVTIPDVTTQNQSNTAGNNAAWNYVMPAVDYIDDGCTNTMYAPTDSQVTTFTPQQDMVWQVDSSYRQQSGFSGHFNVNMTFGVTLTDSAMYVGESGTIGVTNKSDCNTFACSCNDINASSSTHSSGSYIMSIPVPSTDYDAASAQ